MLKIKTKRNSHVKKRVLTLFVTVLLLGGAYILSLIGAPAVAPLIALKPINVSDLPAPLATENRIIIPKIGVNIIYATGTESLGSGAQWRYPERGNPVIGGNFIVTANRFVLQPTPQSTIEKSPFYNLGKLVASDKIVVDYQGVRYGYEIDSIHTSSTDKNKIESPTEDARLTLFNIETNGLSTNSVVLTAKPLGKVAVGAIHSTD